MRAIFYVPAGTHVSIIEAEYPDVCLVEEGVEYDDDDFRDRYDIGNDDAEEDSEDEFLKYDEAVTFIGFVEGAIPSALAYLDGNGSWAESMIRRKDFSTFAVGEGTKSEWECRSRNYWAAYAHGQKAREAREK